MTTPEKKDDELVKAGKDVEAKAFRKTLPVIDYADLPAVAVDSMNTQTLLCAERFAYAPGNDPRIVELLRGESQAVRIRLG